MNSKNMQRENLTCTKICGLTEWDSGLKTVFKARTEWDKARQPFCHDCAIEQDITDSGLFIANNVALVSEKMLKTQFIRLRCCNETFVRLYYQWNSGCLFNLSKMQIINLTLAVVLLYSICYISVCVVHPHGQGSRNYAQMQNRIIQLWAQNLHNSEKKTHNDE